MSTAAGDSGLEVRVAAQLLADGRMEFALHEREADGEWGERRLSARRFFPANATVGRWLSSSPLTVSVPGAVTPGGTATPTPSATECSAETTAARVTGSIALVRTSHGSGTAFYIGDSEWVTAEHVVTGETSVRLTNATLDVTAQVMGTRADVDLAVLSASTSAPALSWGALPGIGAETLVMGYGQGQRTVAAGITRGIVSERYVSSENGQTTIRTDAPANPGNSGGPLLNLCGDVIGVVQSKLVSEAVEGVAYAIAADSVRALLPSVRAGSPTAPSAPATLEITAFCNASPNEGGWETSADCRATAAAGLNADEEWSIWVIGVEDWANTRYSLDGAASVTEDSLTLDGLAPGEHSVQVIEQQAAGWTEWSTPYVFTIRSEEPPRASLAAVVSFLDQAWEDVLGFSSEMTNVDTAQPSRAAAAFDDISARAQAYSDAMWNDYDLSSYGSSCDAARMQISNAAGWFSNAAGWYELIYRFWPTVDYFDEVSESASNGSAALQSAITSRSLCAAGQ